MLRVFVSMAVYHPYRPTDRPTTSWSGESIYAFLDTYSRASSSRRVISISPSRSHEITEMRTQQKSKPHITHTCRHRERKSCTSLHWVGVTLAHRLAFSLILRTGKPIRTATTSRLERWIVIHCN